MKVWSSKRTEVLVRVEPLPHLIPLSGSNCCPRSPSTSSTQPWKLRIVVTSHQQPCDPNKRQKKLCLHWEKLGTAQKTPHKPEGLNAHRAFSNEDAEKIEKSENQHKRQRKETVNDLIFKAIITVFYFLLKFLPPFNFVSNIQEFRQV